MYVQVHTVTGMHWYVPVADGLQEQHWQRNIAAVLAIEWAATEAVVNVEWVAGAVSKQLMLQEQVSI